MNLRWIVGGAAWVAFAAAVWFVGDMLGPLEGTMQRIALIVLVGAVFVAWEFWRTRRAAKENEQLLAGLVGSGVTSGSETNFAGTKPNCVPVASFGSG